MKQIDRLYFGMPIIVVLIALKRIIFSILLLTAGWLIYDIFIRSLFKGSRIDQAFGFLALWFIIAYIFIPRIHRILTKLYIPDYFIGRIRTVDGLLSDPVNLAFIGSEQQLHEAMLSAGWLLADQLNIYNAIHIVFATILHRDYPNAPVSSGYLFHQKQSFAYQQSVNNKTMARHHVRFWKVPEGWLMPGGYKVDWVAAGTYDRSLGLSYFTLQVTHRIASDTDVERDHIVSSLNSAVRLKKITVIKNYFSSYHHRNGGGDSISTDGALPIVEF